MVRGAAFGVFAGTLRNINYCASRRQSAWYARIRGGAMSRMLETLEYEMKMQLLLDRWNARRTAADACRKILTDVSRFVPHDF